MNTQGRLMPYWIKIFSNYFETPIALFKNVQSFERLHENTFSCNVIIEHYHNHAVNSI